jgi:hypothetical protein
MPYIDPNVRENVLENGPTNAGELNYMITEVINDYLKRSFNYQRINDVMGALEGAKFEMYRRLAAPYEDKKLKENGDVYDKRIIPEGGY